MATFISASLFYIQNFKPDAAKSKSIIDLRPQLISKLQQLVKDGSGGLYNLSIGKIEPCISSDGVDIITVKIVPDSLVLLRLKNSPGAPPEVFRMSVDSFPVDGPGIYDIFHKNEIDLKRYHLQQQ